jgi:hypothetical protein
VRWLYEDPTDSLRERMERAAEIFLAPVAAPHFQRATSPIPQLAPVPFDPAGKNAPARARRRSRRRTLEAP